MNGFALSFRIPAELCISIHFSIQPETVFAMLLRCIGFQEKPIFKKNGEESD